MADSVSITVDSSQDIGIFSTTVTAGLTLRLTVTNSTTVGVFGSVAGGDTITVDSSSDIGIFLSSKSTVTLTNVTTAHVEGGSFGSVLDTEGITVSIDNSSDIGIFCTTVNDKVTVRGSSLLWINLGAGEDNLVIDGASTMAAFGDAGADRVTVRSGTDILIYLGDGNDQAEVFGGSLIRIIGEAGDDQFMVGDGSNIQLDGGDGADRFVLTGGQGIIVRGDGGNDILDAYGGVGLLVAGGAGNDQLRVVGLLGAVLNPGLVYGLLDGSEGDDTLEIRPLLSVADRGLLPPGATATLASFPSWMTIPTWVTAPTVTTYTSSMALVGGAGNDTLWVEGAERLYALGGDDNDSITLQAGSQSEVSGGTGDDTIVGNSPGQDNRIFADQGNDNIRANAGVRLGVFGEQGVDTIAFFGGQSSYARGGDSNDVMEINAGTLITLVGETGDDQLTIRGGTSGIAAGSSGNDVMEVTGGDSGILLGQSGDDTLRASGGTGSVLSGGDGNDTLLASNRGDDLYGDDGDDSYTLMPAATPSLGANQLERIRELQFIDPKDYEPEARGSDTIDLSAFSSSAALNLGITGVFSSMTTGLQSVIAGQLQLILLGTLENIVGTSANDLLTGNSQANRLVGNGGNDTLVALGGDDTLEGGAGNDALDGGSGDDLYVFATTAGNSLGTDLLVESTSAGIDSLDFSGLPVGLGTLDLNLATPQSLAGGLINLTLRQSTANAARGDIEEVIGTPFDDTILGNELDNRFEAGKGNDVTDGRAGSDVYVFAGRGLGNDSILDASGGSGRDTLDFAAFDAPLNLDLSLTTPQNLTEMTITLGAADSIENVVGTSFDDVLLGNARDNTLYGAAGIDRLDGRAGNDKLVADLPSVVLLDFDSAFSAARGDYNYSTAERNAIQQQLTNAYAAFNWVFTQSESQAQTLTADMGRNYVRLAFSQGRGGGVSGDAGQVDFRNISRRLVSEVNINSLLPTVRGLLVEKIGPAYTVQDFSNMVVTLTSTIAAHELAHTAGLRHGDSLGPIGTGVFAGTDTSRVYPPYSGAIGATETGSHIMASPASVGTSIADAVGKTFFGEREAIKLAFNEIGRTQRESGTTAGSHSSIATAENLGTLAPLAVPNLAPSTGYLRSNQSFRVSALAVVGDLITFSNGTTERDFYKFTGVAGEYVNIELLANSLRPLRGSAFDSELRIFKADGTLLALNDDDFEGTTDAMLMDVLLPSSGDYFVSVGLSPSPAIASSGGRYELFLTRFSVGPTGPVPGDTLIGGAGNDTLIGGAADDLFLAQGALSTDIDTIDGRAGYDTLDKQGRVYNYTSTSLENVISGSNAPPTVTIAGPVDGVVGQSINFTFTAIDSDSADANGPFELNITWGDGTSTGFTLPAGQRTVTLSHTYATVSSNGQFTISAVAKDARQLAGPAATKDFAVTGFTVMPDPVRPGQTILVVVGTQGADTIAISEVGRDDLKIRIRDRESCLRIRGRVDGDVNRILVFALDGNDQVIIDDDVDVNAEIWGGRGNDYIQGGGGDDIVWGGAGDDTLFGEDGRDILIGGTGADQIVGDEQDDILIGGLTTYDEEFNQLAPSAFTSQQRLTLNAQRLAMEAILAEWTSARSYTQRVNNILGVGTGTRLNGNNFLKVSDTSLVANTVFDDGAQDKLWGSSGVDWFFANIDGDNRGLIDRILDGVSNEVRTDIDKWW